MRFQTTLASSALLTLLWAAAYASDNQQQNRDRLKTAAETVSLDGKDVKPWHWLMNTTAFDKDGKNETHGSIEMWFGNGAMRTTVRRGAEEVTVLRSGDTLYWTGGDRKIVVAAMFLQMEALHPIVDAAFQPTVPVGLSHFDAGQLKLDCYAPTLVKVKLPDDMHLIGHPFSYYFVRDTPQLLVTYGGGGIDVIRSEVGVFQAHQVPVELPVLQGKTKIAEAKTIKLSTVPFDPSLLQVTPDMTPFGGPIAVTRGEMNDLKLSGPPPIYPMEARVQHLSGTVVIGAVIGKDGHVSSLTPIGHANSLLVRVSKDAVQQWIYRPFEINGVPCEVETEIKLGFNIP